MSSNDTTIKIKKDTHHWMQELKHDMRFKSFDEMLNFFRHRMYSAAFPYIYSLVEAKSDE